MLMNWITHKPGQQPAWETGEIGHLISSALTEMPEKEGPSKPAPPSSWSRGFCIWEMIHWSQLKPSFFQSHSRRTANAASQPAESTGQLSSLVLIGNAARVEKIVAKRPAWPHQEYTSTFACIVSDPFRTSGQRNLQIFSSKMVRRSTHHAPSPSIPFETDPWRTLHTAWPKAAGETTCKNRRSDKAWYSHQAFRIKG